MRIIENASLRAYNTFGINVRARYLAFLSKAEDVAVLTTDSRFAALPKLVLGSGSNLLFRGDYPGLVALVRFGGTEIVGDTGDDVYLRVAAGENWHGFVQYTIGLGLTGLENLSLIPGTVGAAPLQNIGAYGVELSARFESLEAVNLTDGRSRTFAKAACGFGYRHSVFKATECDRYVITAVTVRLSRRARFVTSYGGVREELARRGARPLTARRVSEAVCCIRRRTLPDPARLGNAGSFFQNPIVDDVELTRVRRKYPTLPIFPLPSGKFKLPAAWLIEQCGWKGYRRGDAGVYAKHALVLINYGAASGADIWHLAEAIMASVQERFGILLVPEPVII